MKPQFFITGTDTGIGKTFFTSWLVRAWRKQGNSAVGLKPLATGTREDAEILYQANEQFLTLDEINPVFLQTAAAPLISARVENRRLDFAKINESIFNQLHTFPYLAVEGVGGWRVPLAPGYEVRDWAQDLGLPVVVVAQSRLGALNHTLLTVESIQAMGLTCAGIVLNIMPSDELQPDIAVQTNTSLLANSLPLPIFQFDSVVQASGKPPIWLGGKET